MTTYEGEPIVIPGQLSLGPLWPKEGTVKAAVLELLLTHPEGMCRRDAANSDIFELSNRIGELERDGWAILHEPRCKNHFHNQRFTLYRLAQTEPPKP